MSLLENAQRLLRYYELQTQSAKRQKLGKSVFDFSEDVATVDEMVLAGDALFASIVNDLENNLRVAGKKLERSSIQKRVQRKFLNACLPMIYGKEDWDRYKHAILKRHGITKHYDIVIFEMARRRGKTKSCAQILAVIAHRVAGLKMLVFSLAGRTSKEFMKAFKDVYHALDPMGARVTVDNMEQFEVGNRACPGSAENTSLHCLPNSDRLRGLGGDILTCDEGQFLEEDFYRTKIMPLFKNRHSVLFIISSPEGSTDNYVTSMAETIDARDGLPMVDMCRVPNMCEKCIAAQTMGCEHLIQDLEPWMSTEREEQLKELYKNDPMTYMREIQGVAINNEIPVFDKTFLDAFKARPRTTFVEPPLWLFTYFDSGESISESAWVTVALDSRDRFVVRFTAPNWSHPLRYV